MSITSSSYYSRTTQAANNLANAVALLNSGTSARDGSRKTGGTGSQTSAGSSSIVSISGDAKSIDTIKQLAKDPAFRNAAQGVTDDTVRGLVRDGKIPTLPSLTDDQRKHLSKEELAVYSVVSGLQGLYDAQPKSLDDALAQHVKQVTENWPDMIAREKADMASGKIEDNKAWRDEIARQEDELSAAQQGRMKIQAVDNPSLVRGVEDYTMQRSGEGWSGSGQQTVIGDRDSLAKLLKTNNFLAGSSPYTSPYAITW